MLDYNMAQRLAIFRQKAAKSVTGKRPGADQGAIWRRKRSKDAFSLIWVSFLVDFGTVLDNFGRIFCDFSSIADATFERIQALSFFTPFPSNSQSKRQQTSKPTNQTERASHLGTIWRRKRSKDAFSQS